MENKIHSTVIIEGDVTFGKGNEVLPYTILKGPLEIGDNNIIGPHVVVGSSPGDTRRLKFDSYKAKIKIGNNNIIREFTAIQKPVDTKETSLANNTYIMQGVHIPHDVILEEGVVLTANVSLAGITRVMEYANIGMGATIHQYSVIGPYSIVATGAAVIKNVKPFSRYIPGKPISVNSYAIKKYDLLDYTDEITKYVIEDVSPTSDEIGKVIKKYERLHGESGRRQY